MSSKWRRKERRKHEHQGLAIPNPQNPQTLIRREAFLKQQIQASFFSGPLPPPEQLEHYERVHAGLAERIVKMTETQYGLAEQQTKHRIDLEKKVINHNIVLSYLGWASGTFLGVGGLTSAVILIHQGREMGGGAAFVASLATLAGLFFYGRQKQGDELARKRQD